MAVFNDSNLNSRTLILQQDVCCGLPSKLVENNLQCVFYKHGYELEAREQLPMHTKYSLRSNLFLKICHERRMLETI